MEVLLNSNDLKVLAEMIKDGSHVEKVVISKALVAEPNSHYLRVIVEELVGEGTSISDLPIISILNSVHDSMAAEVSSFTPRIAEASENKLASLIAEQALIEGQTSESLTLSPLSHVFEENPSLSLSQLSESIKSQLTAETNTDIAPSLSDLISQQLNEADEECEDDEEEFILSEQVSSLSEAIQRQINSDQNSARLTDVIQSQLRNNTEEKSLSELIQEQAKTDDSNDSNEEDFLSILAKLIIG